VPLYQMVTHRMDLGMPVRDFGSTGSRNDYDISEERSKRQQPVVLTAMIWPVPINRISAPR
jgi:hypothetical protein